MVDETVKHNKSDLILSKINDKQLDRIKEFITLCENEIEKSSPDLTILKRFVNNITNYYSKKLNIPNDLDIRFQKVKKSVSNIKKKGKQKL